MFRPSAMVASSPSSPPDAPPETVIVYRKLAGAVVPTDTAQAGISPMGVTPVQPGTSPAGVTPTGAVTAAAGGVPGLEQKCCCCKNRTCLMVFAVFVPLTCVSPVIDCVSLYWLLRITKEGRAIYKASEEAEKSLEMARATGYLSPEMEEIAKGQIRYLLFIYPISRAIFAFAIITGIIIFLSAVMVLAGACSKHLGLLKITFFSIIGIMVYFVLKDVMFLIWAFVELPPEFSFAVFVIASFSGIPSLICYIVLLVALHQAYKA